MARSIIVGLLAYVAIAASALSAQAEANRPNDAHFNNFGLFGTPQRAVVGDLNDFDEVTIGPWGGI